MVNTTKIHPKDTEKEARHKQETEHDGFYRQIMESFDVQCRKAGKNLDWLYANLHPSFFITMKEEPSAITSLAMYLHDVPNQHKVILADQEKKYIVARQDIPGSLYETLNELKEQDISYAELIHSYSPIPGSDRDLEIQKYEFERKSHEEIAGAKKAVIPGRIKTRITSFMKTLYPSFDFREFDRILGLIWHNNEKYVRISPLDWIARLMWVFQQGIKHDGLFVDVERPVSLSRHSESIRLFFSVGNPPQKGFMTQVSEVFQRLNIGVRSSYNLNISTGVHPYFLGIFYVLPHGTDVLDTGSDLFLKLKKELYNTQILSTSRTTYVNFVANRIMTGEEASLSNAFIAFCHTGLAHNEPDRFALDMIKSAFYSDPDMTLRLINTFRQKFDPDIKDRDNAYNESEKNILKAIQGYNTGHKYLDEIRKTIFRTSLLMIRHTLKTNFFVPEKHALAFRLDPCYLEEIGEEFTSDLPPGTPFRVTFFFSRYSVGYHIGFSDIARGGWRTVICTTHDEYTTNINTLFREVFVLAHTQHLKNKDIYEGGSKLTVVVDAGGCDSPASVRQRLNKVQFGINNSFLDIFVTKNGTAKNRNVVDYYGDDEAIELGPDENMHDDMIEYIAKQSVKRGYILGIGIMSSKRAGINHKEYGVTSRGVIKFAEIAMKELGIQTDQDSFTVKITGGTNGDVAGNCLRLLLERSPRAKILSIVAGTGALYDPEGTDRNALSELILKHDVVDFDPEALHPGGFILFRKERRRDGLRELYRKISRTSTELKEEWITEDEFYREFDDLIFSVSADLFLPCGGRPETIDKNNWQNLLSGDGTPTARVISEGANSFITPFAREKLQKKGVVILRDASANKCGVISSSYEIIANLLMTEKEFLDQKEAYVQDVLNILEKRVEDEANLIFRRYKENGGAQLYTEISRSISMEINEHYANLFNFFKERQELLDQPVFLDTLLNHLPPLIMKSRKYRGRVKKLPEKIKCAILASEISSLIVYQGGWEADLETRLKRFLKIRNSLGTRTK